MTQLFGLAFLRGVTTFTLADLAELGTGAFDGDRISLAGFRLAALFRPASRPAPLTPRSPSPVRHAAYQELLAAEYLRTASGRDTTLAAAAQPKITEQVRQFLHDRADDQDAGPGDCVVPAGTYLVGPSHHLMLRRLDQPLRLDRFPVTVARYKLFLAAIERDGSVPWDHPDMPADQTHQPLAGTPARAGLLRRSRLRQPPGDRCQLVERMGLRRLGRRAPAHLPGMGSRRPRPRRPPVPLGRQHRPGRRELRRHLGRTAADHLRGLASRTRHAAASRKRCRALSTPTLSTSPRSGCGRCPATCGSSPPPSSPA